jgi:type II secretory pathway pseudopilin PulG
MTVSSCERKGTVSDIARIQQADRAIKLIRNALEEYYIKYNSYPPNNVDLEQILIPYMQKFRTPSGDSISQWEKEIKAAFSKGPFYSTGDPELNYFVKAMATDINKTTVSARPSLIRKKKEEENNKKKKGK